MLEIERKYLGDNKKILNAIKGLPRNKIKQAYLFDTNKGVLRVREELCFTPGHLKESYIMEFKGRNDGIKRTEIGKALTKEEAEKMFFLCDCILEKDRYCLDFEGHVLEIDVFKGHLEGLIIVEVELEDENTIPLLPNWGLIDVSNNKKYYNNNLIKNSKK